MPHDKHGRPLYSGDKVIIEGIVKTVHEGNGYCNVTLELPPMPPYTDPYSLTLNSKQVSKVGVEINAESTPR